MEKIKPHEQANFVGIGLFLLFIVGLALFFDLGEVRGFVERAGVWGPIVFILLKISTVVIAPLSGSPLYPLVGLLFGFWPGMLYVAVGDFLGYTIAFFISRIFGRGVFERFATDREESLAARIVEHVSDTKGFIQACIALFALPEVVSYGAGLSKIPYWKFILIMWPFFTAITAVLVFLGSWVESGWVTLLAPIAGGVAMIIGGTLISRSLAKK